MARRLNHSLDDLLTARRETTRVGSLHELFTVSQHFPFRDQFSIVPVGGRGTHTARGVGYWVGDFLAAGINRLDGGGSGFAAYNFKDMPRESYLLKRVLMIGRRRRYLGALSG